jgi:dipeptidyl aminopeptidase/acylaminoacyl peptidase
MRTASGLFSAVALGALSIVLAGAGPASSAFPGVNGKIAFTSSRNGNQDVYVMDANGANQRDLTSTSTASDTLPQWSPNGKLILFQSFRNQREFPNDADVYVMNADGTDVQELTFSNAFDGDPAWSSDGRKIAFESRRDGNNEIYTMNANGSATKRLTFNSVFDGDPAWSPDGKQIAFSSDRDGNREIYVMNADGSNQRRLTHTDGTISDINPTGLDADPAWAPDGKKIAFESNRDGGNYEIYVMGADGSDQRNLSDNAAFDALPAWAPDGRDIVFESERAGKGNWDVYVMTADSGRVIDRLTTDGARDEMPDWQPVAPRADCTITGTAGNDVLTGTSGKDVICALQGDDVISGGGGNDVVYGDAGDDVISGGAGNDTLIGGTGSDLITGGSGHDRISGGRGADTLAARDHQRDVVDGGPGRDRARWDQRLDRVTSVELRR